MSRFYKAIFASLFVTGSLSAQVQLGPTITAGLPPAASDSICAIQTYIDTTSLFLSSGYQQYNLVNDFTLYTENGTSYTLSNELASGQPALLVCASYTCPPSRASLYSRLQSVYNVFNQQLKIFVIYIVEAHPDTPDPSPYSGSPWQMSQNVAENIFYRQPTTYGERMQLAHIADSALNVPCPVLIDDACNSWWMTYGPSPNNAYLIQPDGLVYKKYGWFRDESNPVHSDIMTLLQTLDVQNNASPAAEMQIFPNPVEDGSRLFVRGISSYDVSVHDLAGRCVFERQNISHDQLDLGALQLSAGTYVCTVTGEAGTIRLHRKFTTR